MTRTTTPVLLRGVDRRGERYRVRKSFPPPFGRVIQFFDSPDAANQAALELERRRRNGLPPSEEHGEQTLAAAADALLVRKRVSGRRGPLQPGGLASWERSLAPWREGPYAATPLSLLRRDRLEDAILARAAQAPTSARNERQALLAALAYAGDRGASFDPAILRIPPVAVVKRRRRALAAAELEFFARHVPDYARRLVLFQGTVGNRIEELFLAEPEHVSGDALYVPAANCKERRDKWVPLTAEELLLVREQLGGLQAVDPASATAGLPARPAGAARLFTTRTGLPWTHRRFERLVWSKAVRRAAAAWRAAHDLAAREATPFEWWVDPAAEPADGRRRADDDGRRWITSHDLRATAVTLMRDAGVSREDAAARVGHTDDGQLVSTVYDKGSRSARAARALADAAPEGLRAKLSYGG